MKKSILTRLVFISFISLALLPSCKEDKAIIEEPTPDQTSTHELDNIATATAAGWTFYNRSETQTATTRGFVNGTGAGYSGSGFLTAGWQANSGAGIISAWAISPRVILQNGDKISFYTRTINDYADPINVFPDRLQLRLSLSDKDSVGMADNVGLFKVSVVDINSSYSATLPTAYPSSWTRFEGTVSGLNKPTAGRYALRYFVEDGGSAGTNSNGIDIDKVVYTSVNH
jgi:hypothetical protein